MNCADLEGPLAPLPVKNGVAPSQVWLPPGPWLTMGEFLLERFEHVAEADLLYRLEQGDIVACSGEAVRFDTPYEGKQRLWYYRSVPNEVHVPFDMPILYEDEQLIVVDKPHFLTTTPGGQYLMHTALVRVRQQFNNYDIAPLHRLDRETAGVLLFCRKPELRGAYQVLFQKQAIEKEYEAIAATNTNVTFPLVYKSRLSSPKGQISIQEMVGEPNSETHMSVLQSWQHPEHGALSQYLLKPITGRKHQLRLHMLGLGTPILNDSYYPEGQPRLAPDDFSRPLQLLARSIAFVDPISKQYCQFSSQQQLALLPNVTP